MERICAGAGALPSALRPAADADARAPPDPPRPGRPDGGGAGGADSARSGRLAWAADTSWPSRRHGRQDRTRQPAICAIHAARQSDGHAGDERALALDCGWAAARHTIRRAFRRRGSAAATRGPTRNGAALVYAAAGVGNVDRDRGSAGMNPERRSLWRTSASVRATDSTRISLEVQEEHVREHH